MYTTVWGSEAYKNVIGIIYQVAVLYIHKVGKIPPTEGDLQKHYKSHASPGKLAYHHSILIGMQKHRQTSCPDERDG